VNELFTSWSPPEGFDIKTQYNFADGFGGIVIVETSSVAAMYEAHVPWGPFVEWKTVPIVEVTEAMPISQKVLAWRDSAG
jgi:hypothetical protein